MSQGTLSTTPSPITGYAAGLRTDVGAQRTHNEDAAEILDLPERNGAVQAAFVLCDGMGGLSAGDKAAGEAVRVVRETLELAFASGTVPSAIGETLRTALVRANDAVNALRPQILGPETAGEGTIAGRSGAPATALMGTTCVAGVVVGDTLHVAHAGDSRAYLLRGGKLIRLTDDHSYVADRVRAGDITEAEARVSRFRNVITRAIGIEATVNPDVREEKLLPGDTVLICSDGLTTEVLDDEIGQILRSPTAQRASPERAVGLLVDAANKKGGHDNITVYLLRAEGQPPSDAASAVTGPGVVDLDAPRRRRSSSPSGVPALVVVLCALLALAALAAGVLLVKLRQANRQTAAANAALQTPSGVASSPLLPDYARLVYDPPQPFTDFGARGDLLAFSSSGGLYFVRLQSGTITSIGPDGKPLHDDAGTVEVAPPLRDVPSTHIFLAADPAGDVYISYSRNRTIEKRSPDGRVLLRLTGFDRPEAVAVNDAGDLFVVDDNQIKVLRAHLPHATPAPRAAAASKPALPPTKGKK